MEFRGSPIFGQPRSVDEWSVWWFHIFSSSNSKLTSYFDKYPWYFWDGSNLPKKLEGQDVGDLCGFDWIHRHRGQFSFDLRMHEPS